MISAGLAFRFFSKAPDSGVRDPVLDQMMAAASVAFDQAKRASLDASIANYSADQADPPFLIAVGRSGSPPRPRTAPALTARFRCLAS